MGRLVIIAAAAAVTEMTVRPWSSVVVRQVNTTVVPWVAVCIEASCRFDGDQRRLGDVAGAVLEERASRGMRAILATI